MWTHFIFLVFQEDKFSKFGTVSDVYITEKGYAFVTMAEESDAQVCVDELNGSRYESIRSMYSRGNWISLVALGDDDKYHDG